MRLQAQHPNYCPILEIARIANDEATPVELRVRYHELVAAYTYPKLEPVSAHEFDVRNGLAEPDPLDLM
jgi:hypothetical protein